MKTPEQWLEECEDRLFYGMAKKSALAFIQAIQKDAVESTTKSLFPLKRKLADKITKAMKEIHEISEE